MIIGVISDTHLVEVSSEFVKIYQKYLQDVELLIHCGDFVGEEVVSFLSTHPNFKGVRGNCDFGLDLPLTQKFSFNSWKIGLVHGYGFAQLHHRPESLLSQFPDCNLICFGHTHKRFFGQINDCFLLNPGTTQVGKVNSSLAILDWSPEKSPQVEFVKL